MIIAIVNLKGGVAKTTTAVHFAYYLSTKDATALVDGDPNRSAIAWAGRASSCFPILASTLVGWGDVTPGIHLQLDNPHVP